MSRYDARLLRRLEGTTVTTYDDGPVGPSRDSSSSTHRPSCAPSPSSVALSFSTSPVSATAENSWTWVITEKLSEKAVYMTETDAKMGCGASKTVGKFLCHLEGHPDRKAFMRIYHQIPIVGTEDANPETLAKQAVPPEVCGELESFKLLKGCRAVPRFLGHAEKTQGENDLLPGGYVQYDVWEMVPGEPLTEEFFWRLDRSMRDEIRSKFRSAYEQVISHGTRPGRPSISKIIFDQSTGKLHISGFRRGWPILSELKWTESCYVHFELAKRCRGREWYHHPEQWEW